MPDTNTRVYFAPLEGVTNAVYRQAHFRHFSGVCKYFMPFISPAKHLTFSSREQNELAPSNNVGLNAVPQILAKDASLFNAMARLLADAGYAEANLNLGCPSPTVTSKRKGSGMLGDLSALERFLDEIFASPALKISIKTRAGFLSVDEWPALAEIYKKYPLSELILHPRSGKELYSGFPHWECMKEIQSAPFPVIPNGNLFTASDCRQIASPAVMLGRGLIANPALAGELNGGAPLDVDSLREFHDDLLESYLSRWPENAVVGHMHEIMNYVVCCFADAGKQAKALKKSRSLKDYKEAANRLFGECRLCENPGYQP